MKTIRVLLYFLLLSVPVHTVGLNAPALVNQSATTSLYSSTRVQLEQYYGRTDFKDEERDTGWYRVDNFLAWLKQNEADISRELKQADFPLQYPQTLWIYLGARYAADIYQVQPDFTRLHIQPGSPNDTVHVRMEDTTILFTPATHHAIPAAITLGIHEGTHMLPALLGEEGATSLSELASFYSQHEYGLPVKVEDANVFGYGVRDIRLTSYRKGFSLVPLTYEYMLHVIGLAILPELSTEELLSNYNNLANPSDFNLATAIIYWHAARKGQLIVDNQPYTSNMYLKRLLGSLSANPVAHAQTYKFLILLENNLPTQVQQQIETCFPIKQANSACANEVTNWLHKNSREVVQAAIRTLQDVHAPIPPVPHGYL